MIKPLWILLIALGLLFFIKSDVLMAERGVSYSLQLKALAANAGGQDAYALRRVTEDIEWSLFQNTYLRAGSLPLMGSIYSWRHSFCDQSCLIQVYCQGGIGLSTAGPVLEMLWGTNLFWLVRVDVATQIYFSTTRVIFWSYPLWVGFSIPV